MFGQTATETLQVILAAKVEFLFCRGLLKVYSNELFLFQLTNNLCRRFSKIVIILFLSKAVFIKRTLLFQYFVLKIESPQVGTIFIS